MQLLYQAEEEVRDVAGYDVLRYVYCCLGAHGHE